MLKHLCYLKKSYAVQEYNNFKVNIFMRGMLEAMLFVISIVLDIKVCETSHVAHYCNYKQCKVCKLICNLTVV